MDPRLHQGRREARVEALERTYAHKNTTYYVDAANYDHANNKATVVDSQNVPALPCGVATSPMLKKLPSRSLSPSATDNEGR
ncbi:hypothetical protein MRX96_002080 [Rhipicephalus microplus]